MRLLLALLAAVLLAPPALAQAGAGTPSAALTLEPPEDVVRPLQGSTVVPFRLTLHCPPSGMLPPGPQVQYAITRLPAWAIASVSPTTDAIDPLSCPPAPLGGEVVRHGEVTISVTADAPAFMPDTLEMEARVLMPTGEQGHARSSIPVIAGFFSVLDVQAGETTKRAAQGQTVAFPIKVTNFGNANTRVSFDLESVGDGARVVVPADVTLQSRQAGGSQVSADLIVAASRLHGVAGDVPIRVRYGSHYALDANLPGDSGTIVLLLRDGGAGPEPLDTSSADPPSRLRELPLSPLAAIVAGIGAALLRRRG